MRNVERETWTRRDVETRLVAAFVAMPSLPVFASGSRLQAAGAEERIEATQVTTALQWATILADDAGARKYLWAWARCQATGTSFSELCKGMGWPRATVEAARRRGAAAIAQALNECATRLDSENAIVTRRTT